MSLMNVVVQPDVSIIRSCQDYKVIEHFKNNGHSYCFHACGKLGMPGINDTTVCSSDGDCLYMDSCTNNQTVIQSTFNYSIKFCNPPSEINDPADPDLHFHPQCICASKCPLGTGTVCGETTKFTQKWIFVKICTCHCPVQRCPGSDPPYVTTINNNTSLIVVTILNSSNTANTNNNNNTTVLAAAPAQPGLPVLLVDPFSPMDKLEWKLVLKKLFELGLLMVKVYGLVVLEFVVVGIYSLVVYVFIS